MLYSSSIYLLRCDLPSELAYYFLNLSIATQSPGARSYCQKVQPLQVRRLHASAAAMDGEV